MLRRRPVPRNNSNRLTMSCRFLMRHCTNVGRLAPQRNYVVYATYSTHHERLDGIVFSLSKLKNID
jgi:hypothetical protein